MDETKPSFGILIHLILRGCNSLLAAVLYWDLYCFFSLKHRQKAGISISTLLFFSLKKGDPAGSGWWFQTFLAFTPIPGEIRSNLTKKYFSDGWGGSNHQLNRDVLSSNPLRGGRIFGHQFFRSSKALAEENASLRSQLRARTRGVTKVRVIMGTSKK